MPKHYNQTDAAKVAYENLPTSIKETLTESDVWQILEAKFLSDNEDVEQIVRLSSKMGTITNTETVEAILVAEEFYLKQIGVL